MKKIISVLLAAVMIFSSFSFLCYAQDSAKDIPWIIVHGMNGYGENYEKYEKTPYWGKDNDLLVHLREEGYKIYAPTVGPLSSSWDRACELFAQLTGTVVDYGEAHSAKYGHNRYGRDYTGKACMGKPWDMKSKINIICHSLGGPTSRIFISLLAYGSADEISASQENMSPLFEGGHDDLINAMVTLAAPHNGTQLADAGLKTGLVGPAAVLVSLVVPNMVNGFFMLEHWNIVKAKGMPSVINALRFASQDNAAYDITLKGAQQITKDYKIPESILYVTYSATTTKEGITGHQVGMPADGVYTLTSELISLAANWHYDGEVPGKEWESNDGLVPVISSRYPFGDSIGYVEYTEGMELERGVWNVMPTFIGTHSSYTGSFDTTEEFYEFYEGILGLVCENT